MTIQVWIGVVTFGVLICVCVTWIVLAMFAIDRAMTDPSYLEDVDDTGPTNDFGIGG